MKRAIAFVFLATLAIPAFAQVSAPAQAGRPATTEEALKAAQIQAKAQNKNILVKFSASWCGWCHRMSDWLHDTEAGKMVAEQYIIVTLIVDEADNKKNLENPGAKEFQEKLGGKGSGIPFFAMLNKDLKPMINSIRPGEKPSNIGFPVEDFEIAHFMKMIKETSKLNAGQLSKAESSLKETAQKIKAGG
ncbi:MAG: thioredoxin family protein [Fimbriimonadaceae bacterium]